MPGVAQNIPDKFPDCIDICVPHIHKLQGLVVILRPMLCQVSMPQMPRPLPHDPAPRLENEGGTRHWTMNRTITKDIRIAMEPGHNTCPIILNNVITIVNYCSISTVDYSLTLY